MSPWGSTVMTAMPVGCSCDSFKADTSTPTLLRFCFEPLAVKVGPYSAQHGGAASQPAHGIGLVCSLSPGDQPQILGKHRLSHCQGMGHVGDEIHVQASDDQQLFHNSSQLLIFQSLYGSAALLHSHTRAAMLQGLGVLPLQNLAPIHRQRDGVPLHGEG